MDAFSYLSVVLSIVLGLGLAQVLTSIGRLVRHREHVRLDWLPLLWAVAILVVFVQVWWSSFGLRGQKDWTFLGFTVVLAQTALLYLVAAVALPEHVDDGGVDLREHYRRQSPVFFGFLLATLVVSLLKDLTLSGHLPAGPNLAFHAVLGALSVVGMRSRSRRVHEMLGLSGVVGIAAYIGLLFTRLE